MNDKGEFYEQLALDYLQQQGLTLVTRNYQCKAGEIDLIMRQGPQLVFVEVKYRASNAFGGPLAAVTPAKQKKFVRTVRWYLQQHGGQQQACRIDVLAIEGHAPYQYLWLTNAFS
ncbi:YraN family protein [Arsukibacterium sp.]|uniref:YraN family protein n=1 Tax=Arsukibacterium sp. TaxID=1977258 RepID=UPI002FDB6FBE